MEYAGADGPEHAHTEFGKLTRVRYPEAHAHLSTGCDGNIGAVMGRVSKAIRDAGFSEAACDEFRALVLASDSYDDALQLCMRTVVVT